MNFEKLEKNIIDMLTEQQIKIGYRQERIRLYYPEKSICNLLSIGPEELEKAVASFSDYIKSRIGSVELKRLNGERYCIIVSEEANKYVHENMEQNSFIKKLIDAISGHCDINDIFDIFNSESDFVHIEKLTDEDFEYLIYFEDGIPDDFVYCFNVEGKHIIYHRFTKNDYEDMYK